MTSADPEAWDQFVEATDPGSYLQLSSWAAVKAPNGWDAHRLAVPVGPAHAAPPVGSQIGAQILVRRPRPMPWAFAYAPRGPVADAWSNAFPRYTLMRSPSSETRMNGTAAPTSR